MATGQSSYMDRAKLTQTAQLIAADLRTKESKGFGEFGIHRALLPEQLDELAATLERYFG